VQSRPTSLWWILIRCESHVVLIRVTLLAAEPLILQSGYLVPGPWDLSLCQISLEVCRAIRFHKVGVDGGRQHF
jgi:hypothetical protein